MITQDQILPTLLHLQTTQAIDKITVVASRTSTVQKLREAFPGRTFDTYPASGDTPQPELYKELIARMPKGNIVAVALPDQLHFESVLTAIEHGQHVLCVKPLVLTVQ